jgi:YVTN family beta-propeller protein
MCAIAKMRFVAILLVSLLAASLVLSAGCSSDEGASGGGEADEASDEAAGGGDGGESDGDGAVAEEDYKDVLVRHLEDDPSVYVALFGEKGLTLEVDSETDQPSGSCGTGAFIRELALKPDGSLLYGTAPTRDVILVMDTESRDVVEEIASADGPSSIAFTPDGDHYLVAHSEADYVTVHDTETDEELERITVGEFPAKVCVDFQGTKAYVGHGTSVPEENAAEGAAGALTGELSEGMPSVEIPEGVPGMPEGMPGAGGFQMPTAMDMGAAEIHVIDLATFENVAVIPTKGNGIGLAFRPDGKVAYATSFSTDFSDIEALMADPTGFEPELAVIDAESDQQIASLPLTVQDVAFHPDGAKAYGLAADRVYVIDAATHQVTKEVPIELGG